MDPTKGVVLCQLCKILQLAVQLAQKVGLYGRRDARVSAGKVGAGDRDARGRPRIEQYLPQSSLSVPRIIAAVSTPGSTLHCGAGGLEPDSRLAILVGGFCRE